VPNRNWGGQGSLGCDVGYGYLHRIPNPELHNEEDCHDPSHNHSHSRSHGHSHANGEECHSEDDDDDEEDESDCDDPSHNHSHSQVHSHSNKTNKPNAQSQSQSQSQSQAQSRTSPVLIGETAIGTADLGSKTDPAVANTADGFSTISLQAPPKTE